MLIEYKADMARASVAIDGIDISSAVTFASVALSPSDAPFVELKLLGPCEGVIEAQPKCVHGAGFHPIFWQLRRDILDAFKEFGVK